MIDMIDRICCVNKYKYNRYDRSDQLILKTSPTQWQHCYFLFRFSLLIKVSNIVVLKSSVVLLVHSSLLRMFLLFSTQSYSGTHIIGDTSLPTRNGLLLCISRSAVSSWIYPTNRTLFLCFGIYKMQHGGSDNHFKCHSRWLSSNYLCSPFYLGVW